MASVKNLSLCRPSKVPTERVVEYPFALQQLIHLRGPKILDVGCGPRPALWYMLASCHYNVLATDIKKRAGIKISRTGKEPAYFVQSDITRTTMKPGRFDGVFCISTLEHIQSFDTAIQNMGTLAKPFGIIVVTVPFSVHGYIPNVMKDYDPPKLGYTQVFSLQEIDRWTEVLGDLVDLCYWKCWTGRKWRDGKRMRFPKKVEEARADLVGLCWRTSGE